MATMHASTSSSSTFSFVLKSVNSMITGFTPGTPVAATFARVSSKGHVGFLCASADCPVCRRMQRILCCFGELGLLRWKLVWAATDGMRLRSGRGAYAEPPDLE